MWAVDEARVLKVMRRHVEGEREADGLRLWDGDGAVRLLDLDEDDDWIGMVLERCVPGTALGSEPAEVQDVVVCGLLRRLWVAPPVGHRFPTLASMCRFWADEHERKPAALRRLDAGLERAGLELFRSLPLEWTDDVVLTTDLHAGNVLAAQREPWLMIDPKPHIGDPHYDVLQHLLNRPDRLAADPLGLVALAASLLDLDRARLRQWLFARCVIASPSSPQCGEVAVRAAS